MSRETRLLVVTITLSVLVLALLSRFRFAEGPPAAVPTPAPLQRLAARATYDELAAIVAGVQKSIASRVLVLRLASGSDEAPRSLADAMLPSLPSAGLSHAPALRIAPNRALAAIGADASVLGVLGEPIGVPATISAVDPIRRLAIVEVPSLQGAELPPLAIGDLQAPSYVIAVEGTRAGPSFRPLFIGSNERFATPRWERPLLAMSSTTLTSPGALLFSTEGAFLGAAVTEGGTLALAAAADVLESTERLARGHRSRPLDVGVALQALNRPLAAALGTESGVVVASVAQGTPSEEVLEAADVIVSMDGLPVDSPDDVLLRIAQTEPGAVLTLGIVRGGEPQEVALMLPAEPAAAADLPYGMRLAPRRGGGSIVVEVAPAGAAAAAGLRPGDAIVGAGRLSLPSPSQLSTLLASPDSPPFVALALEREGRRRIVALALRAEGDGAR
jgi:hypothetical protein